jgi:hypothetical protein
MVRMMKILTRDFETDMTGWDSVIVTLKTKKEKVIDQYRIIYTPIATDVFILEDIWETING